MDFILRPWSTGDAASLAKAANNPNIAKNLRNVFPCPYSLGDAQRFIADCIAHEGDKQLARAIAVDGKAVGSIGIFQKDDVYEKSGELGYWLAEEYWRQGITSQAVRQICRDAFSRFGLVRVFAEPFEHNTGSRRVLEKAGFAYEGTMRSGVYKNGQVFSYCMYSILREELRLDHGRES